MDMEGMSYENAHSDGHGCGLFCLHIIAAAFDAGSGSSWCGGSGAREYSGSSDSSVACDAGFARCTRDSD